jgi:hypothetical protein
MIKIKFNPDTKKFDLYKENIHNDKLKEVFEESLTHEEMNKKIEEYSTQIFNMINTINTFYLAVQEHPSTDILQ